MSRTLATYTLRHAIVRETRDTEGNERAEELKPEGFCVVVKRPRAKDLRIMDDYDGREISGSIALLSRISNLSAEEADLLDGEDLAELGNLLSKAAPRGQETGETA